MEYHKDRINKLVIIYEGTPVEEIPEYLKWLKDTINKIPKEYQNSAGIEHIANDDGYGFIHKETQIYYFRPETEIEFNKRKTIKEQGLNQQKVNDLQKLKELKEKYE